MRDLFNLPYPPLRNNLDLITVLIKERFTNRGMRNGGRI
jgi:hypothetical protein